jgi:hypothetical protein
MTMRDGMPGPGWWIASDGRWYPPELHPDVRASAVVVVDDPTPPAFLSNTSLPSSLDASHEVSGNGVRDNGVSDNGVSDSGVRESEESNGAISNGRVPFLATLRSTDGAPVATRDRDKTTDAAPRPPRSGSQRLAFGAGLAVATLLVIVYFAGGHDVRPSLDTSAATTAPSTTVRATSATAVPASAGPPTAAAPSSAPSASSASSASSTTAPRAGTTPATSTVTSAAKIAPKVVSVFDLVKGNCLDGASLSDGLVTTIRVVDCSEVHTHEVYYSGRYPESTFDANKISNYANDTCLAQFAPYVGIDYTRSRYQYLHIVPTQESWTRDNDRDVVCVAFEEDATITGTIAGRKQ